MAPPVAQPASKSIVKILNIKNRCIHKPLLTSILYLGLLTIARFIALFSHDHWVVKYESAGCFSDGPLWRLRAFPIHKAASNSIHLPPGRQKQPASLPPPPNTLKPVLSADLKTPVDYSLAMRTKREYRTKDEHTERKTYGKRNLARCRRTRRTHDGDWRGATLGRAVGGLTGETGGVIRAFRRPFSLTQPLRPAIDPAAPGVRFEHRSRIFGSSGTAMSYRLVAFPSREPASS